MIYLLDTNAWIRFLNADENAIKKRVSSVDPALIRLCSVVKAELYFGAEKSSRTQKNLNILTTLFSGLLSLDFDDKAAREYGRLRAQLERAGSPLGPNDLMIASIAVANQCVLVTHNVGEFSRIITLEVEDWE